jgi:hypothetical protein
MAGVEGGQQGERAVDDRVALRRAVATGSYRLVGGRRRRHRMILALVCH